MMSELTHRGRIVRATMRTKASGGRVWDAWANPDYLAQWFPDRAEGEAEVGRTMTWKFDRFDMEVNHKVLFAEKGERLVLGPESPASPIMVEITIEEVPGETVVRVTNSGLNDDSGHRDEIAGIESGWQMTLGVLKYYVENHFGETRKSFFAIREADFEYENLAPFYSDGFKLAQWLTNEGAVINGKPSVRLVLRDGRTISGAVLTETPREIALSWEEINGVIELKAISLDDGRRAVCIRGCGWGLSTEEARVIESSMDGALGRLVAALGN